jgi:GNAT superfamily N-acetyltransferase
VAVFAEPDSPLNKLAGLGFGGPLDEAELEEVERAFDERGAPLQVELSNLGDASVGALLTRRGYVLQGFENVLGRALPAADLPDLGPGIAIDACTPEELDRWIDVVVTGFATPDAQGVPSHESYPRDVIERVIRDMVSADGVRPYLAHRDGIPAGGGSMRLSEGVAQLCGTATLPEHRRRGVQSALLAERLALAGREGCDVAVVTTQPGSKSQENVQRQGFQLLYTRAVLVREPDVTAAPTPPA